jgi:hypothetical protein
MSLEKDMLADGSLVPFGTWPNSVTRGQEGRQAATPLYRMYASCGQSDARAGEGLLCALVAGSVRMRTEMGGWRRAGVVGPALPQP